MTSDLSPKFLGSSKAIRLLLVEDTPDDIEALHFAIANAKSQRKIELNPILRSGSEALQFLQSNFICPDLIILDWNLPPLSGAQILECIRQSQVFALIPVFVLSSSKDAQDISLAYRCGANAYLVKPFEIAELIEIVEFIEQFYEKVEIISW